MGVRAAVACPVLGWGRGIAEDAGMAEKLAEKIASSRALSAGVGLLVGAGTVALLVALGRLFGF